MTNPLDTWMIDELLQILKYERLRVEKITGLDEYLKDITVRADQQTSDAALAEIENCKTHPIGKLMLIKNRLNSMKQNYGLNMVAEAQK